MGRLEKQIIAGALALVGILLVVVVYRGLDHNKEGGGRSAATGPSPWQDASDGARRLSLADAGSAPAGEAGDPAEPDAASSGQPAEGGATAVPLAIGPIVPEAPSQDPVRPVIAAEPEPRAKPPVVHRLSPGEDWDVGIRTYLVQDGDTLGHIAQRELGSTRYVGEIEKLNEGIDSKRLRAGQAINLPTHVRGVDAARSGESPTFPAGTRTHSVVGGDTLWTIAARYYGHGSRYQRILDANDGMSEDDVLQIGSRIAVPE